MKFLFIASSSFLLTCGQVVLNLLEFHTGGDPWYNLKIPTPVQTPLPYGSLGGLTFGSAPEDSEPGNWSAQVSLSVLWPTFISWGRGLFVGPAQALAVWGRPRMYLQNRIRAHRLASFQTTPWAQRQSRQCHCLKGLMIKDFLNFPISPP